MRIHSCGFGDYSIRMAVQLRAMHASDDDRWECVCQWPQTKHTARIAVVSENDKNVWKSPRKVAKKVAETRNSCEERSPLAAYVRLHRRVRLFPLAISFAAIMRFVVISRKTNLLLCYIKVFPFKFIAIFLSRFSNIFMWLLNRFDMHCCGYFVMHHHQFGSTLFGPVGSAEYGTQFTSVEKKNNSRRLVDATLLKRLP